MSPLRFALATAAGLGLATLPFVRYMDLGGGREPHSDHAPRHGGQLAMVGDHHIEVRRRAGRIEVFVSDAWRRPVRPQSVWVVFDGAAKRSLDWEIYRLAGDDDVAAREVETIAILADGTRLAISMDFSG